MTTQTTEKFEVRNRWTGKVAFTAEIETTPDMSHGWKLRLAVAWTLAASVPCRSLNLDGVDFSGYECPAGSRFDDSTFVGSRFDDSTFVGSTFVGSTFDGSTFDGSRFVGSTFVGSTFDGSRLVGSTFVDSRFVDSRFDGEDAAKEDFMLIMAWSAPEIPALIAALREGRVNGSAYSGECACLVGTIANARGVLVGTLEQDSDRPAERWFLMISKGDKAGDSSPGGYAAQKALEWAEEFQSLITA